MREHSEHNLSFNHNSLADKKDKN